MKNIRQCGKVQRVIRLAAIVALVITVEFVIPQATLAQQRETEVYFRETGHWVTGEFLTYFQKHSGWAIFGYPITEQFIAEGVTVQYFQKARLEWHPENPESYQIQLGLLGEELHYRQPAIPEPLPRSRRKVYFPETGHTVAHAFLDFFKANGGIDIFGYPISETYFEDGQIVQYFQRLKLQWQPNDPTIEVTVGNLGEIYVNVYGSHIPSEARTPLSNARAETARSTALTYIDGLHTVVSVHYSVIDPKRSQIVSVLVTDNNGHPLQDARVEVCFIERSTNVVLAGSDRTLITDKQGSAQVSLPVNKGRSGRQILVRADVSYGVWKTTAHNVFLLW